MNQPQPLLDGLAVAVAVAVAAEGEVGIEGGADIGIGWAAFGDTLTPLPLQLPFSRSLRAASKVPQRLRSPPAATARDQWTGFTGLSEGVYQVR